MNTYNDWNDGRWDEDEELLAYYTEKFNLPRSRTVRKPRTPKNARRRFQEHRDAVGSLADDAGLESVWEMTYTPARFESGWLKDSLRPFYEQEFITDVTAQVKGGKEANVYRCRAHGTLDVPWLEEDD